MAYARFFGLGLGVGLGVLGCSTDTFVNPTDAATATDVASDQDLGDAGGGDATADADASRPGWAALTGPSVAFDAHAISVLAPDDIWLGGGDNAQIASFDHWVNGQHNVMPGGAFPAVQGMVVRSETDGMAVTDSAFMVYNGNTWTGQNTTKGNLVAVWARSKASDYYAANALGRNFRYGGSAFVDMSGAPNMPYDCHGMSAMFTVCANGEVLKYDDGSNAYVGPLNHPPSSVELFAVDHAGTDTYAVGSGGVVANVGSNSVAYATPLPGIGKLYGVWISGAGEIFAVGENGAIIHRIVATQTWEQMPSPTTKTLRAVGGVTAGGKLTVFAAGDGGTLLRYVR